MADVSTRFSRALMVMGATLGIATVTVTALELRINLPDWLVQVAMAKLAIIGSLGLLGAGAVLGRHAVRQKRLSANTMPAVGKGSSEAQPRYRERDPVPQEAERRADYEAK